MNEEIMRKLEAMQVINRQLHEKLEQAKLAATFYREKINAESNHDSTANQSGDVVHHSIVRTVDFDGDVSKLHAPLSMLRVYDGIQILAVEDKRVEIIVKLLGYLRNGRIPGSVFSTRRNSHGVIVWRID
jgi:hypothetical protein